MTATPNPFSGLLSGVRILDFTWWIAGPLGPRMLTPYGAEVIHIEPPHNPDHHRFDLRRATGPGVANQKEWWDAKSTRPYYTAPDFSHLHSGKLGVNLNARHPEGVRLLERLIEMSDALCENFSGGVLDSWGLGWDRLREINPRLVYQSTSGFGHEGEWSKFRTLGPSVQATSGLTFTSGLPGAPPAGWGYAHMDVAGGWAGGLGLMMGLMHAKRTGKGLYVDYSVTDAAMFLLGPYFLDYQVNNRPTRRPGFPPGNRSEWPIVAPHNTYRCAGMDRQGQDWWVFVACETQEQFEALCGVMGKPELMLNPKFATMERRVQNQDELDEIISTWTAPRRRYEIMDTLQSAGIIAAAIQGAEDRVEYDPQLRHRGIYPVISHPEIGDFEHEAFPPRMSRTPPSDGGRAPLIGEHTQYVYGDLLGLSSEEITSLHDQGVI